MPALEAQTQKRSTPPRSTEQAANLGESPLHLALPCGLLVTLPICLAIVAELSLVDPEDSWLGVFLWATLLWAPTTGGVLASRYRSIRGPRFWLEIVGLAFYSSAFFSMWIHSLTTFPRTVAVTTNPPHIQKVLDVVEVADQSLIGAYGAVWLLTVACFVTLRCLRDLWFGLSEPEASACEPASPELSVPAS